MAEYVSMISFPLFKTTPRVLAWSIEIQHEFKIICFRDAFGNLCHLRNGSFDLHKVGANFLKVMHYSFQDKKSADQDLFNAFFGFLISHSIAE